MVIQIISLVLGILSLLYFGIYAAFAGLNNKFTYFWLLFGILCLLLAVFRKQVTKLIGACTLPVKIIGAGVVLLCILALAAAEGMIISYGNSVPEPGADYVIVLGAQVRGRTPSYNLARRLDTAYGYLKDNPQTQVILSGGQGSGEDVSEAYAMAEYLEQKGIERDRMILEDQSVNTWENLQFSMEKADCRDASVVLVTSGFHVFRSVRIAGKEGYSHVESLGAPVMWYTVPNLYLREGFAVLKYAVCGQI